VERGFVGFDVFERDFGVDECGGYGNIYALVGLG
jgi:hypothetical protein